MAKKDMTAKHPTNALEKLFLHALGDIYAAEKTAAKALKSLAATATLPSLQAALTAHGDETEAQRQRLKEVFEVFEAKPKSIACKAISGIVDEGDEIMDTFGDTNAADAAAIFVAQAIEHYEINRLGALREWAEELGKPEAARLLAAILDNEYAADKMLTKIAEEQANIAAEGRQPAERPAM